MLSSDGLGRVVGLGRESGCVAGIFDCGPGMRGWLRVVVVSWCRRRGA